MQASRSRVLFLSTIALAVTTGWSVRPACASVTLVTYSFGGNPGSLSASNVNTNSTATPIDFTGSASSQGSTNPPNSMQVDGPSAATSESTAVSSNSYFEFTIAPKAGYADNMGAVNLTLSIFSGTNEGYGVRSSLDGFASDLGTGFITADYPSTQTISVLLPAQFQGVTSPTEFRVYDFAQAATVAPIEYFSSVSVGGSASAVPEPTTLAVLGIPAVMALLRRRRKLA